MNLLEKRQDHQGTLCSNCGALRLHVQRGIVSFASLPSRRLCWRFFGNPKIKKRKCRNGCGRWNENDVRFGKCN